MSNFYIVGTPIGNLEDITLRALNILKSVDLILCEDTRVTKKLLNHYGIETKTISYHTHSDSSKTEIVIDMLRQGKNLALVTDAGTPGISDPGSVLVSMIRQRMPEEISDNLLKIHSIPGPSALTTALSISGVPHSSFTFLGFLPHKKGRETLFNLMLDNDHTYVFYESPHRILKTLERLKIGDEDKNKCLVTVCRELTKIYEQVISGTASFVYEYFEKNKDKVKGEFVVIVSKV